MSDSGPRPDRTPWESLEQVRPGEMVALLAPPPAAVSQVVRRCQATVPELLVVDATAPEALADLDGLARLPRVRRVRLGLSVVVVTDDLRSVADLVDRSLSDRTTFPQTEHEPGKPLLLGDIDDDIAYFGVLDGSRWEHREQPLTRAHSLR